MPSLSGPGRGKICCLGFGPRESLLPRPALTRRGKLTSREIGPWKLYSSFKTVCGSALFSWSFPSLCASAIKIANLNVLTDGTVLVVCELKALEQAKNLAKGALY